MLNKIKYFILILLLFSTPVEAGNGLTYPVLSATTGGVGNTTGALKSNGSGLISQASCSDLSNATSACSTSIGTSGAVLPLLNTANTWSGTQSISPTTLTRSSSTYTPTFATSNTFQLVLDHATCTSGSPCTIANPSGTIVPGTDLVIEIKQSSTGGDYATYGSYYKFPNSLTPVLSTSANATDLINCHVSDATHLFCGVIGNFAQ